MSTRGVSARQEKRIAKLLGGDVVCKSGGGLFDKGDVACQGVLIECKTAMEPKKSFTIRRDVWDKIEEEAFAFSKEPAVAFNYGEGVDRKEHDFFIIRDDFFKELYEVWLERGRLSGYGDESK